MKYYRFKDNFYKVEKEDIRNDGIAHVEYSEKVGPHIHNHSEIREGLYRADIPLTEWNTRQEIRDLEFYVWRHIKPPHKDDE